ncbi:hypothetical protein ACFPRL_23520 [Pseudoclavibacter helvolus]
MEQSPRGTLRRSPARPDDSAGAAPRAQHAPARFLRCGCRVLEIRSG